MGLSRSLATSVGELGAAGAGRPAWPPLRAAVYVCDVVGDADVKVTVSVS